MTSHINGIPLNQVVGDGVHSGVINVDSGKLEIDEVAVTASAAELNVMDGLAIPQAELMSVDPSQKFTVFSDFNGIAANLSDEPGFFLKAGSGTGNAVTGATVALNGVVTITSASDDGAFTANASMLQAGDLHFQADQGGLAMEARLKLDAITNAYIFVGFTDAIQTTTLEEPIMLVAGDIDSTATDACGLLFDTDGTTSDLWCHGGVKAGTDTVPAYHTLAPVAGTYQTLRVEVSSAGAVTGYVNGVACGSAVANAVTATVPLVPIIVVANRGAAARVVTVDYMWAQQNR